MSLKIFNENELSSQIKSGKDKSNKIIIFIEFLSFNNIIY